MGGGSEGAQRGRTAPIRDLLADVWCTRPIVYFLRRVQDGPGGASKEAQSEESSGERGEQRDQRAVFNCLPSVFSFLFSYVFHSGDRSGGGRGSCRVPLESQTDRFRGGR